MSERHVGCLTRALRMLRGTTHANRAEHRARPSVPVAEPLEQRRLLSDLGIPFRLKAGRAPGLLQAENFDYGGEGVAYHDATDANLGGLYRKREAADIAVALDGGAGYCVTWTNQREWLRYTVDVAYTAKYDLAVRVASRGSGGTFHLEVDGTRVTRRLTVPNTRGTQNWTTLTTTGVPLTKGRHVLRLFMSSEGKGSSAGSFNWLAFSIPTPRAPGSLTAVARSDTHINLSWQDNSADETAFHIERRAENQAVWQHGAVVASGVTSYDDPDLAAGTQYEYRVRASNGLAYSGYVGPTTVTTQFYPPIVITSGGVYSGRWESLDPQVPAVLVQTAEPVVIENSVIRSRGDLIVVESHDADITVRNTKGVGLNPNVVGQMPGRFLTVDRFVNVVVENNDLEGTTGIYLHGYLDDLNAGRTVRVLRNRAKNIDGRSSDGNNGFLTNADGLPHVQFFQIDGVPGLTGAEVAWNQVINEPRLSLVEDNISIFASGGTSASPLLIHDNYIQGAYAANPATNTDYSGGGIMLSDLHSSFVHAFNNHVIGTSNYGIAISSGHDNEIDNNRVLSSGRLPDGTPIAAQNTGIYIWNQNDEPTFARNIGHDNLVGWQLGDDRNDWWVPDAESWINNTTWPGNIGPEQEAAEWNVWQQKLHAAGVTVGPKTN